MLDMMGEVYTSPKHSTVKFCEGFASSAAMVVMRVTDADLVACTKEWGKVNEPKKMTLLAGLLFERSQKNIWVVACKYLITTHKLMNDGDEVSGLQLIGDHPPCPVLSTHYLRQQGHVAAVSGFAGTFSLTIKRYSW
jgi:ANTH domain